ncbi:MAG: lysylphosphatidylglycerol synthase transmembrane domain-containing protein [Bacteroidetes bacterium]|nr:lysylphosphatidylglycerol synthase transmembrane domain-containing protein [Bacteroidota bacterium]
MGNLIKFFIFLGIGGVLIWLSVKNLTQDDITHIKESLANADYSLVILSTIISILAHISRAIRWKMLLAPLNHYPKTSNTFFAVMVGYLANYSVPRLGEISRCGVLTRYEKIPFTESLGTVVVERIFDVICFFLIVGIMLLTQAHEMYEYLNQNFFGVMQKKMDVMMASPIKLSIVIIIFVGFIAGFFFFRKKIFGMLGSKISGFIQGFIDGMQGIRKLKSPWLFIAHSIFIWVVYYGCMHIIFLSIKETAHLSIGAGLTVFIAGTLMVMVTPGGLGAFPIAVQSVLLIYAINSNTGLAVGWLVWLAQFVMIVLVGLISLILLPILNRHNDPTPTPAE